MERKYIAFISYRHMPLDMMVAEHVHKLIEHYHIPKDLRNHPNKKRFDYVFRDREELPLSNDLTKDIYDALDASEFLIVICTPDTPKSKWIEREIEYFLKHHERDKILTVLASGTPAVSIPERITNIYDTDGKTVIDQKEPLCAFLPDTTTRKILRNLRKEWLRLAAALLEKPYDTLRQRRRLYQMKLGLLVLSSAIMITGAYAGMLVSKNHKIREKNIQIQQQIQETQWNESQALTLLSGNLLADGDRKGALENAIAALPTKENPRPYYSGAKHALEEALYIYEISDYRSDGKIEFPTGIDHVALSKSSQYLVGATDAGRIVCYDLFTQKEKWNIPYPDNYFAESFYFFEEQSAIWYTSCGGAQYILDLENGEVKEYYQFTARTFPLDYSDIKNQAVFSEKNQFIFCDINGNSVYSEEIAPNNEINIHASTYNTDGTIFMTLCSGDFGNGFELRILYFRTDTGSIENAVTLDASDTMDEIWHSYILPLQDGSYFLSFVCQEVRMCVRTTDNGDILSYDGFYFPDHYSNYGNTDIFSDLEGKIRQVNNRIYMACPNRIYCIDADTCSVLSETYFEDGETFCKLLENGTLILLNEKNELCQYQFNETGELIQTHQWICPIEVHHYWIEDIIIWSEKNPDVFLVNEETSIRIFRMLGEMDGGEKENCYQLPVELSGNYPYLPSHSGAFINPNGTKIFFRDANGDGTTNQIIYDMTAQKEIQRLETIEFPLAFTSDGKKIIDEDYSYEPGEYGLAKQTNGMDIYNIKNNQFEAFDEIDHISEDCIIVTTSMNDQKDGEAVISATYSEGVLHWWKDGTKHQSTENPYYLETKDLLFSIIPGQNGLIVTKYYIQEEGDFGEVQELPILYAIYDTNTNTWKKKEAESATSVLIQPAKTKPWIAFIESDTEDAYVSVYDFEKDEIITKLACEIAECEMISFLLDDTVLFVNYDNLFANLYTFIDISSGEILGQLQGNFHDGIYGVTNKNYLVIQENTSQEYLYISSRIGAFDGLIINTENWSVEHEIPGMLGYLSASDSLLCIDDTYRNVYTKKVLNLDDLIERGNQVLNGLY